MMLVVHFHLIGGLGYKINSKTLVYSLIQRVLMTLSVLTFFSGVRIEVGEFCNSLTEVPCCEAVHGYCFLLVTGTR